MKIKLYNEQMEAIKKGFNLIINNEKWRFIDEIVESDMDDHGKYNEYIYQRPSDNKYFRITIFLCRYGYEDYGFEFDSQDNHAYEVEKREVVKYEWVYVV